MIILKRIIFQGYKKTSSSLKKTSNFLNMVCEFEKHPKLRLFIQEMALSGKAPLEWTSFIEELNKAISLKWYNTSDGDFPEINHEDPFSQSIKESFRVLCYSKDWGPIKFGIYNHVSCCWYIEGVHSSNGVSVDKWTYIQTPKK